MIQDTGNQDGVQWGPEIAVVGGDRPNGLPDMTPVSWKPKWNDRWIAEHGRLFANILVWNDNIRSIRLPANHPYYATLTQKPGRTPAQVARMEALVRRMAAVAGKGPQVMAGKDYFEARAIVVELDPADGDLVEAREVMRAVGYGEAYFAETSDIQKVALAALKRGRELQKRGEG